MPLMKTLHSGGIVLGKETLFNVNRGSRTEVIKELNDWLFDYCFSHNIKPSTLPPLDDWHHSEEDVTYYYVAFPDAEWQVWMKAELIEFR